jgi:hypothetical protein
MTPKEAILREVDDIPEAVLSVLHEFVRFLKHKGSRERLEAAALSGSSLEKVWLRPEEDEAWADLQRRTPLSYRSRSPI